MVLRGAQIHRRGQARCSLVSTRSLPHDLARLYGRTGLFTSADLGGVAGPCLDEVQIWTDSHGPKSFSATRSRCREARLPRNQLPDAKSTFYVRGPMNRIIGRRPNTCRHTYVFRTPDGGCHDL
jgi:hypothetical protein